MFLSEKSKEMIRDYIPQGSTVKDISDFFSVFADATRIKILTALLISEMTVSDISSILDMHQSTISHQLKNKKVWIGNLA